MKIQELIIFNGITYRLMGTRRYYLSQSKNNKGRRKAKSLHVAIWEYYSSKIVPKGFIVHHKDGNCFNNEYENLECITRVQHNREHFQEKSKRMSLETNLIHLKKIRPLAAKWHGTDEGRTWHSKNAIKHIDKIFKSRKVVCFQCKTTFITVKPGKTEVCSPLCRGRLRIARLGRFQNVCIICGNLFEAKEQIPKSRNRKTCSKVCQSALRVKTMLG